METIVIQAEPKKKKALIEILTAFEVPFTVKKTKELEEDIAKHHPIKKS